MTQDDIVKHISGPAPAQSKLSCLNLTYSSPPSSSVAVVLLLRLLLLLLLLLLLMLLVAAAAAAAAAVAAALAVPALLLLLLLPRQETNSQTSFSKPTRNDKTPPKFVPKRTQHRIKQVPNVSSEILENSRINPRES